ncbi:hypothetical protein K1514_15430 [Paraclostridium bifermentans]|uniref:hypothetical protein n=1 Tax=Paraclostridium TaxID=1849822 RepID=UPI001CC78E56|nr:MULTISPECIES: hypothetical protein [Paraclostridium]MBZ6007284.1 hypothetical protein [Paraclostridium bifermentans]MDU0297448.1 hypothetical protein [Paraclostridium sp. MRS3W1]
METIFSAVIFSIPGFFAEILEDRLFGKIKKEKSDFEKTISAIVYSSFIIVLNLIIMKLLFNIDINTFSELPKKLNDIRFFVKYIILTFFGCILFIFIKKYIWDNLVRISINQWRTWRNLPQETKFSTIWEEVFENSKQPVINKVISIEKDGDFITCGVLSRYSAQNGKKKEFLLIETAETANYIKSDKDLSLEEKLLYKIDMEYYDQESGHLIKFYNTDKLYKYLEE